MPSPFPGMDPYLENPARWSGTHQGLIGAMRALLNKALPKGYVARMEESCRIVPGERVVYPDVFIRRSPAAPEKSRGATAVLDAPDTPLILEALPVPQPPEMFIEIRHVADGGRVVTAIEILSPTNKTLHSDGRRMYLRKQEETLRSAAHLIEIDLLRHGPPTVAALAVTPRNEPCDYLVSLHRSGQGQRFEVWPNRLRERLPKICVPLMAGDADITLDIQAVFDKNYEEGAYAEDADYRRDPVPPLSPEDAAWADALLREKGLRP